MRIGAMDKPQDIYYLPFPKKTFSDLCVSCSVIRSEVLFLSLFHDKVKAACFSCFCSPVAFTRSCTSSLFSLFST